MSHSSATRELLTRAQLRGWTAEHSKGGHFRLTHPIAGGPVFIAKTTSDHRGLLNARQELIRREREVGLLGLVAAAAPAGGEAPGEKLQGTGGVTRAVQLLLGDFAPATIVRPPAEIPPPPRMATGSDVLRELQAFAATIGVVWPPPVAWVRKP